MSNITIFEEQFDNVAGFKMPDLNGDIVTYTEGGGTPALETVTKTYTPTTSQQTETITPSSGYDGIGEVDVTVNAMPTGSYGTATWSKAIQQNKLFVSPSFANFDDGYFANAPSIAASLDLELKSVTPSETAQTVAPTDLNHYLFSVNVGAIPSEYVVPTGTKSITSNGTGIDVTNYAAVNVNVSGGGSDILPSGYEQLEYIRFSGSQYINTNITPVEGDTIKMIVLPQTNTGAIFSCGAGTYQLILLNLQYYKYFATGAAVVISPTLSANKVYEITASSTLTAKTAGSSDLTVTSAYASSIDGASNKLWIGARVNNSSYFTGCVFSFSLTNAGTAKANFVPCVRESDGKAGMYDLVSETFFPSATSTDIEAGAPAVNFS